VIKLKRLIAIPIAIILLVALAVPALADPWVSITSNLDGLIVTGMSTTTVDQPMICEMDETKTITGADIVMGQTLVVEACDWTGEKTTSIDWTIGQVSLSESYDEDVFGGPFLGSNTLVALPTVQGTYVASTGLTVGHSFDAEMRLEYEGEMVTHDPMLVNHGDVNTGVGMRLAGNFVGLEVTTFETTNVSGILDLFEFRTSVDLLSGTVQTGLNVDPGPHQWLDVDDCQSYEGLIDHFSKSYTVADDEPPIADQPVVPFPWPCGWP
jgi:hypothetical protein